MYREACGYIQTLEDEAEYEAWAADVDAATIALPARDGAALAQQLAGALFDGETSESTADGEASEKAAGGCESSGCC